MHVNESTTIDQTERDGAVVLSVDGPVDLAGSQVLAAKMTQVAAMRHAVVVVDLSACEIVASLGMGEFVACRSALQGHDGSLRLCGMNEMVRSSFEAAGLSAMFPNYASAEEALRAA